MAGHCFNKWYFTKSYFFLLIGVCMFVSGCITNYEDSSATVTNDKPPIYLVLQTSSVAQIWYLIPEGGLLPIYVTNKNVGKDISSVLPVDEIRRLQSHIDNQATPVITATEDLVHSAYISQLALSPTKKLLAWHEGDLHCVDGSVICYGVQRVVVSELNRHKPEILLQVPLHGDQGYNIVAGPIWSPDGQYLAIVSWVRNPVPATITLIQVNTGEVIEIVGTIDSGPPLIWSPDSTVVAWDLSGRFGRSTTGGGLRLFTLSTATAKDIQLDGLWIWNWGLDWSPQENRIVFSGVNQGPNTADGKEIQLYLLDPDTSQVHLIPVAVDGVLENPRWSPDGQLLAADLSPTVDDLYTALLIIEPDTGSIVTQLTLERAERVWSWDREGKNLLILLGTGTYKSPREVGIFNIEEGTLRILPLPEELAAKQIRDLSW